MNGVNVSAHSSGSRVAIVTGEISIDWLSTKIRCKQLHRIDVSDVRQAPDRFRPVPGACPDLHTESGSNGIADRERLLENSPGSSYESPGRMI